VIIGYLDVLPLLVAACPTWSESHRAVEIDLRDGEYLAMGHFVEHLIDLLDMGKTDAFPAVFGVVEWVLVDGEDEAVSVLVEGFFDDLADPDLYTDTARTPEDFAPWLGPHARELAVVRRLL
jgi:hypothetical protein